MATTLPQVITSYYAAEQAGDFETLARCFAPDGTVRDEAHTHQGRAAIAAWMTEAEAKAKYRHRTEILGVRELDGVHVVSVRVSGQFPNSPVTLENSFRVADGVIQSLEIG